MRNRVWTLKHIQLCDGDNNWAINIISSYAVTYTISMSILCWTKNIIHLNTNLFDFST